MRYSPHHVMVKAFGAFGQAYGTHIAESDVDLVQQEPWPHGQALR